MRLTTSVYLYVQKEAWQDSWELTFSSYTRTEDETLIFLEERKLTYDLPRDWDPRELQVAALRAKLQSVRADAMAEETKIVGKINDLLSLEMKS